MTDNAVFKENVFTLDVGFDADEDLLQLIVIKAITTCDIEDAISAGRPWSFSVLATNGDIQLRVDLNDRTVEEFKMKTLDMTGPEWARLVYQLFFSELDHEKRKTTTLTATASGSDDLGDEGTNLVLGVTTFQSENLSRTVGRVPMKKINDDDDTDVPTDDENINTQDNETAQLPEFDLFQWMAILSSDRDRIKDELDEERAARIDAESKNNARLDDQEKLVANMKREREMNMKIYTAILNKMKERYMKALDGEITRADEDEEDIFNERLVMMIKDRQMDGSEPVRKKRKVGAPKKRKSRKNCKKTVVSDASSDVLLDVPGNESADPDELEEIIPDSDEEKEREKKKPFVFKPIPVKQESLPSSPTKASKAVSLTSFNPFRSVKQESQDQEIPLSDEAPTDVELPTDEEDVPTEDEGVDMDFPTDSDSGIGSAANSEDDVTEVDADDSLRISLN